MNLPGFSAEAALGRNEQTYRTVPASRSGAPRDVVPQVGWRVDPECMDICLRRGRPRQYCFLACGEPLPM